MWEKLDRAEQVTDDNNICACASTKATNTHLEYVIIIALSRQQSFRERETIVDNKHIISSVINPYTDNVENMVSS